MREGWREVRLGDVLTRSKQVLGAAEEPSILTVTEGNGLVDQLEHWGRRVATENVSKYKVVRPNALVYNVYLLWLGAIGRNATGESAITSPVYEVFDVDGTADARYVEHLVRSDEMRRAYAGISIGTVPRRRRTPWQAFLQLPIPLPPLAEQRRIVDLIAAVDDAIEAAEREAVAAAQSLSLIRHQTFAVADKRKPAGIQFDIAIGKQRSAIKVEGDNVVPYLRSANVELGRILVDDVLEMHFSEREAERLALANGDVLVTEGSASERAVGVPAVWHEEIAGVVGIQNALIRIRAVPGTTIPSFAEHWAFWAYESGAFREIANGTNIKHVGVERAKSLPVVVLDEQKQLEITAPMDAARDSADAARTHADSLRTLRSNLLTVLLSGEHEIPATYDQLLDDDTSEGAAA